MFHSRRISFPPILGAHARLAACAAAVLCILSAAQAQGASGGYTAKELKPPLGYNASRCDHATRHSLGDNGDVSTMCSYTVGYYFAPEYFGLLPLPYQAYRPVVWRNGGSASTLSLPSGYEIKATVGVDAQGRVLGHLGPIRRPNTSGYDVNQEMLAWWSGTQRSIWSTGLPGMPGKWMLGNVTASGKLVAYTNGIMLDGRARLVVLQGATATDLPLPPSMTEAAPGSVQLGRPGNLSVTMNDKGEVAVLTFANEAQGTTAPRVWLWNGQAWREVVNPTTPFSFLLNLENITAGSELAFTDRQGGQGGNLTLLRYHWSETGGLKVLPPDVTSSFYASPQQRLDDGTVAGQAAFPGATDFPNVGTRRAALWRQGEEALDLNSLLLPPSGYVHHEVLDVNARGQLLVRMLNTDSQSFKPRLWLLTPQ